MPKVEATTPVLIELSQHVYMGQLKTLKISRYKTGANAGKLFAEYSLKDKAFFDHDTLVKRTTVSDMLKKAAKALAANQQIELSIQKRNPEKEEYNHMLSVKQVPSV